MADTIAQLSLANENGFPSVFTAEGGKTFRINIGDYGPHLSAHVVKSDPVAYWGRYTDPHVLHNQLSTGAVLKYHVEVGKPTVVGTTPGVIEGQVDNSVIQVWKMGGGRDAGVHGLDNSGNRAHVSVLTGRRVDMAGGYPVVIASVEDWLPLTKDIYAVVVTPKGGHAEVLLLMRLKHGHRSPWEQVDYGVGKVTSPGAKLTCAAYYGGHKVFVVCEGKIHEYDFASGVVTAVNVDPNRYVTHIALSVSFGWMVVARTRDGRALLCRRRKDDGVYVVNYVELSDIVGVDLLNNFTIGRRLSLHALSFATDRPMDAKDWAARVILRDDITGDELAFPLEISNALKW